MPKDHPASLAISKSEVVFEGKIWDIKRESFDYNGETLVREFVAHPGAVAVIALNDSDQVLLINQYRHPVREFLWEIPAGLLDMPGESKL
jgi:ADP-ribose pyrophosphatase